MPTSENLDSWIDDLFFSRGSFATLDNEKTVIFGKGGFFSEKKISKHDTHFYIKEFYHEKFYYYYPENLLKVERQTAEKFLEKYSHEKSQYVTTGNFDHLFEVDFKSLKEHLKNEFKKAVLVSAEKFETTTPLLVRKKAMAKSILSGIGSPYGIWDNELAIIGTTPEVLFERQGNSLETIALAGTGRIGEEKILLDSTKDRIEHDVVIQNIIEELSDFCESLEHDATHTCSFANMIHLKTPIKASLKQNVSNLDIINSLSPTAALGGYPKQEAKKFLQSTQYYEQFPKRFFGSVLGINHGETHRALVMIRNIQLNEDHILIETGAGIIKESIFENEINEINLKRTSVKELLL
jgi:menaquinone-specific isochorismate synthase